MQQKLGHIVSKCSVRVADESWTPIYSETSFRTEKFYGFDSIFRVRYGKTMLTLVITAYVIRNIQLSENMLKVFKIY